MHLRATLISHSLLLSVFLTLCAVNDRWSHASVTSTKSSSSRKCRNDVNIDDWKSFHFSAYCWSDGVGDEISIRELWFVSCEYIVVACCYLVSQWWAAILINWKITLPSAGKRVFLVWRTASETEGRKSLLQSQQTLCQTLCEWRNYFYEPKLILKHIIWIHFYDAFIHSLSTFMCVVSGRDKRSLDVLLFMLDLCCECVWRAFN